MGKRARAFGMCPKIQGRFTELSVAQFMQVVL